MWKEFDRRDTKSVWEMEAFIQNHPKGHFMQMPNWAGVKSFWMWRGISIYREDELAATVSVLIRRLALGMTLFYIPRGPVCDRNDPSIWQEIMEALQQTARKYKAILLYTDPDELDSNEAFRGVMEHLGFLETSDDGFGNIQPQYVFRLDLADRNAEDIFQAFTSKTRYNIGLSQRKGVHIREYAGSDVIPDFIFDHFYALMQITGERDHFYIRNQAYFQGLLDALQDDARIFIAYLHGQPIAGAIEVFCGKKAWYLYGASSNEHRNAMPNYLLQWTMIQRAMDRGCDLYDFRGVPGNPSEDDPLYGLYRFKKGFNGELAEYAGEFSIVLNPFVDSMINTVQNLRKLLNKFRH